MNDLMYAMLETLFACRLGRGLPGLPMPIRTHRSITYESSAVPRDGPDSAENR